MPMSDSVVFEHLSGKHTIGVYPLLLDETCHFLAVDFDEADWKQVAQAFRQSYLDLGVPIALEVSRSGNGAHAWIFFARAVPASKALRNKQLSENCAARRSIEQSFPFYNLGIDQE
jgi:hypothetical protein